MYTSGFYSLSLVLRYRGLGWPICWTSSTTKWTVAYQLTVFCITYYQKKVGCACYYIRSFSAYPDFYWVILVCTFLFWEVIDFIYRHIPVLLTLGCLQLRFSSSLISLFRNLLLKSQFFFTFSLFLRTLSLLPEYGFLYAYLWPTIHIRTAVLEPPCLWDRFSFLPLFCFMDVCLLPDIYMFTFH